MQWLLVMRVGSWLEARGVLLSDDKNDCLKYRRKLLRNVKDNLFLGLELSESASDLFAAGLSER